MRVTDIILGLVAGRIIGFLLSDFLRAFEINIGLYYSLILWVALPFFSLFLLWLAHLIGRKLLFVFQTAKFVLVGAVSTVVDLKIFELLTWFSMSFMSRDFGDSFAKAFFLSIGLLVPKSFSFLAATILKYLGNKYWTFKKHGMENLSKEIVQFFAITIVGLIIDVASFFYIVNIIGPQFGISNLVWIKLSVIFAAIAAALWNFLGYKFLVFKK